MNSTFLGCGFKLSQVGNGIISIALSVAYPIDSVLSLNIHNFHDKQLTLEYLREFVRCGNLRTEEKACSMPIYKCLKPSNRTFWFFHLTSLKPLDTKFVRL
jgi:hypothetical protein